MAEFKKRPYRLLRNIMTMILIAVMATGATYCLQDHKEMTNEFIGEKDGVKPPKPPGEVKVTITVEKVWEPAEGHPDSVEVQLKKDGSAYSTVILNASNGWKYNWKELDDNNIWTVDELNTPDGYIKTVTGNASSGFVITNKMKSEGGDDEVGGNNGGGGNGGGNGGRNRPPPPDDTLNIHDPDTPAIGTEIGPWMVPKTGDDTDPRPWLIILAVSAIILRRVLFFRKNKI